jgi:nitroreductase
LDVSEVIEIRKSVRSYDSKTVPRQILSKILEAAQLAPSAGNRQPWHFVVVTDAEKRMKLAQAPYAKFLTESPVVIVGCADQEASPKWFMVDVAIALEHIVLAATNEGLGTCWVGSFDESQVTEMLRIPKNFRVVALLALGYPSERVDHVTKAAKLVRRKKMEDIASLEEFGRFSAT